MDDAQIHGSIERLVAEEHELWEREAAGNAADADRKRLEEVKVSLDQCWDLLRQRRALREAGKDPRAHTFDNLTWWRATSNSTFAAGAEDARRRGGHRRDARASVGRSAVPRVGGPSRCSPFRPAARTTRSIAWASEWSCACRGTSARMARWSRSTGGCRSSLPCCRSPFPCRSRAGCPRRATRGNGRSTSGSTARRHMSRRSRLREPCDRPRAVRRRAAADRCRRRTAAEPAQRVPGRAAGAAGRAGARLDCSAGLDDRRRGSNCGMGSRPARAGVATAAGLDSRRPRRSQPAGHAGPPQRGDRLGLSRGWRSCVRRSGGVEDASRPTRAISSGQRSAVDDATWARSRGWVLSQAVGALSYYTLETNPELVREGERWLAEALGGLRPPAS